VSWLIAFLGFSALIILHEAGHFAAAKAVGMRVERFSLFFGRTPLRFQRGETEYGIGWIPAGGYVKITGMNPHEEIPPAAAHRAYYRQPVWKRIVVIAAGPLVNLVLAFLILWVLVLANGTAEPTQRVDRIEPGQPAAQVLQPGDRILAVDGVRGEQRELSEQIARHRCAGEPRDGCRATEPAELLIERNGQRRTVEVTPVYDPEFGRTRLGFSFAVREVPAGPVRAADVAVSEMWRFTTATLSTIAQIFNPDKRDDISSVVGSYEVTRQAVDIDLQRAVYILAVISLSLGLINLFPFLPLDGGHIFWAVAEKVRGRAIPFSVMERAGLVGFALVLGLFFIGLSNDIGRLTGEGFNVR